MRSVFSAIAAAAVLALVHGSASAQSLGEVAARTQKEKDAKAKSAKVFTESDLRSRPSSGGSVSQPGAGNPGAEPVPSPSPTLGSPNDGIPADGKPAPVKPKTPDEERADQVSAWRERLGKAQDDVARLSGEVGALQNDLGSVSAAQYSPQRAKAAARLDAAKGELTAAQASLENIQEEGRRAGMR